MQMNLKWFMFLPLTLIICSGQALSEGIVHDPEFVRMEKEFGKQWRADDQLVREKLAALRKKFGKKPNICISWRMMLGLPNWEATVAANFAERRLRIWTKLRIKGCAFCIFIPKWNAPLPVVP